MQLNLQLIIEWNLFHAPDNLWEVEHFGLSCASLFKLKGFFLNVRFQFSSTVLNPGLSVTERWTQTALWRTSL